MLRKVFLCFPLVFMGSSLIAATHHTGDKAYLWMFCWLPHQEPVSEKSLSDLWMHLKPSFFVSSKQYLAFCPGFSQPFNHVFFCHPPFLVTIKISLPFKILFLLQNNKWCQFPPIRQNWKYYNCFQPFIACCFYVPILTILHKLQRRLVHQKRWISSCVTPLS